MTVSAADFDAYLRSGDTMRAASWLVEVLADDVYGLCRAMVRDPVVAEDLAQDAFSRALAGLPAFRGEASPRTWLLAIARNRCLDHLRRERVNPTDADDAWEDHVDPEPVAVDVLLSRRDIERGLDVLTETERALVVLHHGHGLKYAELAAAFGIKAGTARMRVKRALAKMREELEPSVDLMAPAAGMAFDDEEAEYLPAPKSRGTSFGLGRRRRKRAAAMDPAASESMAESLQSPAPTPGGGGGAPVPARPAVRSGRRSRSEEGSFGGAPVPAASPQSPGTPSAPLRVAAPRSLRARLGALLEGLRD